MFGAEYEYLNCQCLIFGKKKIAISLDLSKIISHIRFKYDIIIKKIKY